MFFAEKRESVRANLLLKGRYFEKGEPVFVEITNISAGGFFISCSSPQLPVGDRREFLLEIDNTCDELGVYCEVARHQVNSDGSFEGLGLKFIVVEPSQLEDLNHFLELLIVRSDDPRREGVRVEAAVELFLVAGDSNKSLQLSNISETGLYFLSEIEFEKGEKVNLSFYSPEIGEKIFIEGIVKRIEVRNLGGEYYHGHGVEFTNSEENNKVKEALKKVLKSEQKDDPQSSATIFFKAGIVFRRPS